MINPGNPTGQCLPEENVREVIDQPSTNPSSSACQSVNPSVMSLLQIIEFCYRERIVLLADEVYQVIR